MELIVIVRAKVWITRTNKSTKKVDERGLSGVEENVCDVM